MPYNGAIQKKVKALLDEKAKSSSLTIRAAPHGSGPRQIDLRELENFCAINATHAEIANVFSVSEGWIDERRRSPETLDYWNSDLGRVEQLTFKEIMERGYSRGRITLRRRQCQLAEQGNPTMLIWLGKQLLGQKDTVENQFVGPDGGVPVIKIVFKDPPKNGS